MGASPRGWAAADADAEELPVAAAAQVAALPVALRLVHRAQPPARAPGGPGALGSPLQDEQRFFTAAPAGAPGGAPAANNQGGSPGRASASFTTQMINDIIPEIDARYRTLADRDHRAMAGLSLGGMQTYQIAQENKDKFAYVGVFSAPFGFPGFNAYAPNAEEFDKTFKAFFISRAPRKAPAPAASPRKRSKMRASST